MALPEKVMMAALDATIHGFLLARAYVDLAKYRLVGRPPLISPGRPMKGNVACVFACFAPKTLPGMSEAFVHRMAVLGYDVVVVNNARFDEQSRARLLGFASAVIERTNIGRDFGAYKDGLAYLLTPGRPSFRRVMLCNDSVYVNCDKVGEFLTALNETDYPFMGTTWSLEPFYHLQSYCLSFSADVLNHPAFRRFWREYRPLSDRRHSIKNGELALFKTLTAAGFQPKAVYSLEDVRTAWAGCHIEDLIQLLPDNFLASERTLLYSLITGGAATAQSPTSAGLSGIRQGFLSEAEHHSQIHHCGLLFYKLLGCPFVKKDLCYRGIISYAKILATLEDLRPEWFEYVRRDLRNRGLHTGLRGLRRFLVARGLI